MLALTGFVSGKEEKKKGLLGRIWLDTTLYAWFSLAGFVFKRGRVWTKVWWMKGRKTWRNWFVVMRASLTWVWPDTQPVEKQDSPLWKLQFIIYKCLILKPIFFLCCVCASVPPPTNPLFSHFVHVSRPLPIPIVCCQCCWGGGGGGGGEVYTVFVRKGCGIQLWRLLFYFYFYSCQLRWFGLEWSKWLFIIAVASVQ